MMAASGEWTTEDEEALVCEWHNHECLFDIENKSFADRSMRIKTVGMIAEKVGKSADGVLKHMRSLRTCYARLIKAEASGSCAKRLTQRQEWLMKVLDFVKPYMKKRQSQSSLDELDQSSESTNKNETEEPSSESLIPVNGDETSNNGEISCTGNEVVDDVVMKLPIQRKGKKRKTSESGLNSLSLLKEMSDTIRTLSVEEELDPYAVFGKHVANELRDINDIKTQEMLKKEINDAIFNAKMSLINPERNATGYDFPYNQAGRGMPSYSSSDSCIQSQSCPMTYEEPSPFKSFINL